MIRLTSKHNFMLYKNFAFFIAAFAAFNLFMFSVQAQSSARMVVLEPTGNEINGLPEMTVISRSSLSYLKAKDAMNRTFVGEAVELFHLAQRYLYNIGELDTMTDAYLAVTKNQGGFPRYGFYLKNSDGSITYGSKIPYVDLTPGVVEPPFHQIQSFTQIYPHELTHIIYKLLCSSDSVEANSYNVNMHYFSVLTEYNTAFNEGFAEHMENISRLYEPDLLVREGIQKNIVKVEPFIQQRGQGFEHDFKLPLRLGFYKASMIVWYQQFEGYKRYKHAVGDEAIYLNSSPQLRNVHDMMSIRNTGLRQSLVRKNSVQLASCEGFVSSFFTHLATSKLPNVYRNADFYRMFLSDTSANIDPAKDFTPVQNLFSKYFYVLHKYVSYESQLTSPLHDFINGYIKEFPDEGNEIMSIYSKLTGEKYNAQLPPQLWMLVKDFDHRVMVLDPFGAATFPVYTFDLNAADAIDLIAIGDISQSDAQNVIQYRDKNGLFMDYDEVNMIPGLSAEVKERILNSRMEDAYFKNLSSPEFNFMSIISSSIVALLLNGLIWFLALSIIFSIVVKDKTIVKKILFLLKYAFIWVLFMIIGLATVVIHGNSILVFLVFFLIWMSFVWFILRNKKRSLVINSAFTLCLGLIVLYSLI